MKSIILSITFFSLSLSLYAQNSAIKPSIMFVPSKAMCEERGYEKTYDMMGEEQKFPDYKKATDDREILQILSKFNQIMQDRGYPPVDLGRQLMSIEQDAAENALTMNSMGGTIAESPVDILRRTAKADIWIEFDYQLNVVGPKKSITFRIDAYDSYTDKPVASASGTGEPSFSSELAVLVEEAVLSHMDQFNSRLMGHFIDIVENGREVKVRFSRYDNFEHYFTDYVGEDYEELAEIIQEWFYNNTVNGAFKPDIQDNSMTFTDVRIPLYDESGRAVDVRRWSSDIRRLLGRDYDIPSSQQQKGLGEVLFILGER